MHSELRTPKTPSWPAVQCCSAAGGGSGRPWDTPYSLYVTISSISNYDHHATLARSQGAAELSLITIMIIYLPKVFKIVFITLREGPYC